MRSTAGFERRLDAFLREIVDACRKWPRAELPSDYFDHVQSDAPTLLISGSLDPVLPPSYGAELARHLTNATHLVIPTLGHPFGYTGGCHSHIVAEFIEQGSMRDIDTSCLEGLTLPPFAAPQ